jgi:hypothetical protein
MGFLAVDPYDAAGIPDIEAGFNMLHASCTCQGRRLLKFSTIPDYTLPDID